RAPEAHFSAEEIGLEAFGENVENRYLLAALQARAKTLPALVWVDGEAEKLVFAPEHAVLVLKSGARIEGELVVGADGRSSLCRAQAAIGFKKWNGQAQHALTLNLRHGRPHHDTSTEFHTETGPF